MAETRVGALAREAVASGDYAALLGLVRQRPLELWFEVLPSELYELLVAVPESIRERDEGAILLLRLLSNAPTDAGSGSDAVATDMLRRDEALPLWATVLPAIQMRLRGDAPGAYELIRTMPAIAAPVPSLIDASRGVFAFQLVQTAMTAMLAGRFVDALALYEKATLSSPPASLAFFLREAHTRAALIHVLFGDRESARTRLIHAAGIARTGSWAETLIDGDEALVRALLLSEEDPDQALAVVEGVPLEHMGEMWPFWVAALMLTGFRSSRRQDVHDRLLALQQTKMGDGDGAGFAGAVLPVSLALHALSAGHMARVREILDAAHPGLWVTRLITALYAISVGATDRALRLARSVRDDTRGLRRAEECRLAVMAFAYRSAGADAEAAEVLEEYLARSGADTVVVRLVSPALYRFAAQVVPGWPSGDELASSVHNSGIRVDGAESRPLTERELQVLARLARGETRREAAQSLYLSVNTVKTHQRSLYRKLDVSSVSEALLVGERLGLI